MIRYGAAIGFGPAVAVNRRKAVVLSPLTMIRVRVATAAPIAVNKDTMRYNRAMATDPRSDAEEGARTAPRTSSDAESATHGGQRAEMLDDSTRAQGPQSPVLRRLGTPHHGVNLEVSGDSGQVSGSALLPDTSDLTPFPRARRRRHLEPMRYPNEYVWFVFFSSLDIMLTWAILTKGGSEVNPIARAVIDMWGLPGAIGFKFGLMVLVILVCEVVAQTRPRMSRGLIQTSIAISSLPVFYSLLLLVAHTLFVEV